MRSQTSLILLLCLCSGATAQENTSAPHNWDLQDGCWIGLEGNNTIQMPSASFSRPEANWTYPFRLFPIFTKNQTISGSFFGKVALSGFEARVCISNFSISDLLSALKIQENRTATEGTCSPIHLNGTDDASFALEGVRSGLYTIRVVDALNSTVFATTLALVAEGEIATNISPKITAGDFLPLVIETSQAWEGKSMTYGAIMISSQDYATSMLSLATNGTEESLLTTIALGNSSMQIQGMPEISSELLMKILYMLPPNSTIAYQNSTKPEAELYLLTDPAWAKGEYILTSAVYSHDEGLMGLKQDKVEVV